MAHPPFVTGNELGGFPAIDVALVAPLYSQLIRSYCGWHIAPTATETLTLDGNGSRVLSLPTLYLAEVVSLTVDDVEVDADDFEWSERGQLRVPGLFPTTWRSVVVEMTHGYEETPRDVELVTASAVRRHLVNPDKVAQETAAGYSVSYNEVLAVTGLTPTERQWLGAYRLPGRP